MSISYSFTEFNPKAADQLWEEVFNDVLINKIQKNLKELQEQYATIPKHGMDDFDLLRISYHEPEKYKLMEESKNESKEISSKIKNHEEALANIETFTKLSRDPKSKDSDLNYFIADLDQFFLKMVNKVELTVDYFPEMEYFEAIYFIIREKEIYQEHNDTVKIPMAVYQQIFTAFNNIEDSKRIINEAAKRCLKDRQEEKYFEYTKKEIVNFLKRLKKALQQCLEDGAELKLEILDGDIADYKKFRIKETVKRIRARLGRKEMKTLGFAMSDLMNIY